MFKAILKARKVNEFIDIAIPRARVYFERSGYGKVDEHMYSCSKYAESQTVHCAPSVIEQLAITQKYLDKQIASRAATPANSAT